MRRHTASKGTGGRGSAARTIGLPVIQPEQRITNWDDIHGTPTGTEALTEARTCLGCATDNCAVPDIGGCPAGFPIRERQNALAQGNPERAWALIKKSDPLNTGWARACPSPCQHTCVARATGVPIRIPVVEQHLFQHAYKQGWITPPTPSVELPLKVAIIGSGPGGLSAAVVFRQAGCQVVVYERSDLLGGLMIEGIPNFHLEKTWVKWQIELMRQAGVQFKTNHHIGHIHPIERTGDRWRIYSDTRKSIYDEFDVVVVAMGKKVPRGLPHNLPGAQLQGVHQAMALLIEQNRLGLDLAVPNPIIMGDNPVIIGGGLTALDVRGTALRRNNLSTPYQLVGRHYPSNHSRHWTQDQNNHLAVLEYDEGGKIRWGTVVTALLCNDGSGRVTHVQTHDPVYGYRELTATDVIISRGFLGPDKDPSGLTAVLGLEVVNGKIVIDEQYRTNQPSILAVGDCAGHPVSGARELLVASVGHGRDAAVLELQRQGIHSYYAQS